jgi:hypothetical protein
MSEERQPTLFVSHPSTKAETAAHIERALNARGIRCWIAPRDVEPGEQWDVSIRRAIAETDAMLLLFCGDSDRSRQVKRELILADQSDKHIIPIRLERIEPQALSYHLADSQWIDWIEQRDEAIDRIAAKAREFHGLSQFNASAPRDYAVAPPPKKSRKTLWFALGGFAVAAVAGLLVWLFLLRPPPPVTEEWFAGVWSDTRDCTAMYRFDRSGALTDPDGNSGRWRIERRNILVMEIRGETQRRALTKVSEDHVTSPRGGAFRCFGGAT